MKGLPDDLVGEIYDALAVADPPRAYAHSVDLGWIKMTHVSQRWRTIGISLPKLWARVICTFPPDATAILERAGDVPLTIDLNKGGIKYWDESSLTAIISRTQAIIDSSATDVDEGVDWQKILDGRFLPILLKLNVRMIGYGYRKYEWKGAVEAPALRACALNLHISLIARSLESLSISGQDWNKSRFLAIVKDCPALLRLCVHAIWSENEDESSDEEEPDIVINENARLELSHLQTLHVHIFDNIFVSALRHIRFPENVGLRVDDAFNVNVWDYLFSRLQNFPAHGYLSIICTHTFSTSSKYGMLVYRLSFADDPSRLTPTVDIFPGDLVLSRRGASGEDQLYKLLDRIPSLRAAAIRNLDFDFVANSWFPREEMVLEEREHLARSLRRFHNVTTLRIGDAGFALLPYIGFADHGLFPDLHTLIIHPEKDTITRQRWREVRNMLAACPIRIPRLIIRGSMLCHTTEWQHPETFDSNHSWKQILDECFISLEEERLLVEELLDEREGIEFMPDCRCWQKICGY